VRALLLLALAVFPAFSADVSSCAPFDPYVSSAWAVADFDGDQRLDFARVPFQPARNVELFRRCGRQLPLLPGRFAPAPVVADLDNDNDLDLVLREPFARRIVGVWLNDGAGHFVPAGIPSGTGDTPAPHGVSAAVCIRPSIAVPPAATLAASLPDAGILPPAALHRAFDRLAPSAAERFTLSSRGPPAPLSR
jgi:hypothetical protein